MKSLTKVIEESIKPADIYCDGRTIVDGTKNDVGIACVWDDGTVQFRKGLSKQEMETYKNLILKNSKLTYRFNIDDDSFIDLAD